MNTNQQQSNPNILTNSNDLTQKQQEKLLKKAQKNQYKIEKLKAKKELHKEKESISKGSKLFKWKNFFTQWFFIGIGLILISVIIGLISDLLCANDMYSPVLAIHIISGVFSSIGIAFLIGSVFDFSKNSESFIEFVSDILTDIVISKKFLALLTSTGKKNALEMILKPTNEQRDQYSNINEYYKKKIDDSMRMFDTEFKTDLILNIEARVDKNNGFVYCESLLTYTMYKYKNKFSPIIISYEKEGSETKELKIITDDGETEIPQDIVKQTEEISGGGYNPANIYLSSTKRVF